MNKAQIDKAKQAVREQVEQNNQDTRAQMRLKVLESIFNNRKESSETILEDLKKIIPREPLKYNDTDSKQEVKIKPSDSIDAKLRELEVKQSGLDFEEENQGNNILDSVT